MKIQALLCLSLVSLNSWATAFVPTSSTGARQVVSTQPLYSAFSAEEQFKDKFVDKIVSKARVQENSSVKADKKMTLESVLLATNAFLLGTLFLLAAFPITDTIPQAPEATNVVSTVYDGW